MLRTRWMLFSACDIRWSSDSYTDVNGADANARIVELTGKVKRPTVGTSVSGAVFAKLGAARIAGSDLGLLLRPKRFSADLQGAMSGVIIVFVVGDIARHMPLAVAPWLHEGI